MCHLSFSKQKFQILGLPYGAATGPLAIVVAGSCFVLAGGGCGVCAGGCLGLMAMPTFWKTCP